MCDSLLSAEQAHGVWLIIVAFLGSFVFLRLAAKEWAYRETWLRHDARRRAKRAAFQARMARKAQVVHEIEQAGRLAGEGDQPIAAPAVAASGRSGGTSAAG